MGHFLQLTIVEQKRERDVIAINLRGTQCEESVQQATLPTHCSFSTSSCKKEAERLASSRMWSRNKFYKGGKEKWEVEKENKKFTHTQRQREGERVHHYH